MVPLRLTLKDFLSYGESEQTLDFQRFRFACVMGNNGDGKSALLDAITWALWGQARGVGLRGVGADSIIHAAAESEEARVEFDFSLGEEAFRVIRSRHRKRGPSLLFGRLHDGSFHAFSTPTGRSAQELIDRLLRMSYDTFVNSAFLLQNRADEFTRQTAAERKRLLAQFLDLDRFALLEARAREKAREAEARAGLLASLLLRLEHELQPRPDLQRQLDSLRAELAAAEQERSRLEQEAAAARARLSLLHQKKVSLEDLSRQLLNNESERKQVSAQVEEFRRRLAELEQLLAHRQEIEDGCAQLEAARVEEARLAAKQASLSSLIQARTEARLALEREEAGLQAELRAKQDSLLELGRELASAPKVEADLRAARERASSLRSLAADEARLRAELDQLKSREALLRRQAEDLLAQCDDRLLRSRQLEKADAACPLCEQALTPEKRRELIGRLQAEAEQLKAGHRDACSHGDELGRGIEAAQAELSRLSRELAQLGPLERRLGELERQLQQVQRLKDRQEKLSAEAEALASRLTREEFGPGPRQRLREVEDEIARLGYDPAAHAALKDRLARLGPYESLDARLQQAQAQRALDAETLSQMEGSHQRLAQQAEQITTSVNLLKQELSSLPGQERSLAEAEARARASAQAVSDLSSRLAVLEAKLQELEAKRQELTRSRQERAKAAEEAVLLRELGLAFGKDGVQALIIEAALPELERDANDLLGRIADGRMQVRFETQRPRKRPRGEDAAETLEIHIRDELGTRPYEMFSGGETFRLDFAIRIALSRLLVRRAGVPLQTLVIDEGFGSQDRQGREKLVEALNAIRSDFECLLVITHVEELKEMFPHHIFVTKDESGSRLFQD